MGQQVLQASKEQRDASEASRAAAASGEQRPGRLNRFGSNHAATGLASAGTSVRVGAETAGDSYRELILLQEKWFAGAAIGLGGMKEQLQTIIESYGDQIDGQTTSLMKRWKEEVAECLQSYETQVSELQGGLDELQSAISKLPQ